MRKSSVVEPVAAVAETAQEPKETSKKTKTRVVQESFKMPRPDPATKTRMTMEPRYVKLATASLAIALSACSSYRIDGIDVTHKEPTCARECTATYSSCVSEGGNKPEILRACRDAYSACVSTCPAK